MNGLVNAGYPGGNITRNSLRCRLSFGLTATQSRSGTATPTAPGHGSYGHRAIAGFGTDIRDPTLGHPALEIDGDCHSPAFLPGQDVQQGGEGGPGRDLAVGDAVGNVGQGHPCDVIRLEIVFWRPDVLGVVGAVDVVHGV
jgi:hypothetical protein